MNNTSNIFYHSMPISQSKKLQEFDDSQVQEEMSQFINLLQKMSNDKNQSQPEPKPQAQALLQSEPQPEMLLQAVPAQSFYPTLDSRSALISQSSIETQAENRPNRAALNLNHSSSLMSTLQSENLDIRENQMPKDFSVKDSAISKKNNTLTDLMPLESLSQLITEEQGLQAPFVNIEIYELSPNPDLPTKWSINLSGGDFLNTLKNIKESTSQASIGHNLTKEDSVPRIVILENNINPIQSTLKNQINSVQKNSINTSEIKERNESNQGTQLLSQRWDQNLAQPVLQRFTHEEPNRLPNDFLSQLRSQDTESLSEKLSDKLKEKLSTEMKDQYVMAPLLELHSQKKNPALEMTAQVVPGSMTEKRLSSDALLNLSSGIREFETLGRATGSGEIRIRLKPESLGELKLQVQTHGNQVHLKIIASDEKAKKVIEETLGYLKSSLTEQNLSLSKVEVYTVAKNDAGTRNDTHLEGSLDPRFGMHHGNSNQKERSLDPEPEREKNIDKRIREVHLRNVAQAREMGRIDLTI